MAECALSPLKWRLYLPGQVGPTLCDPRGLDSLLSSAAHILPLSLVEPVAGQCHTAQLLPTEGFSSPPCSCHAGALTAHSTMMGFIPWISCLTSKMESPPPLALPHTSLHPSLLLFSAYRAVWLTPCLCMVGCLFFLVLFEQTLLFSLFSSSDNVHVIFLQLPLVLSEIYLCMYYI